MDNVWVDCSSPPVGAPVQLHDRDDIGRLLSVYLTEETG